MTREEAINEIKSWDFLEGKEIEAIHTLIPELAESEDERIRKWLCDYFSSIDNAWIHKDITCIDILKWLEKQKEQKPGEIPPYVTGIKGDPDPAGTSDLEEAAEKYIQGSMCDLDDGPTVGLAKESFIAGGEWQKEQKPVEWSEEDEKKLARVIWYVEKGCSMIFQKSDELVFWLKSLRPSWKPSEEQMKALLNTLHPDDPYYHDLKSLYEQLK